MDKEDWIILRLLMVAARHAPYNLDMTRAITHLMKKYGNKTVISCIKQLRKE